MLKRILCITLLAVMITTVLCGCAREAMDDAESMISGAASDINSGVDSMMGDNVSQIPSNPTSYTEYTEETDNPTDGEFGEPNVNDYDDNDSDVVGDEDGEE